MDQDRLELYRTLADVRVLESHGARILASVHPELFPTGTLSAPQGLTSGYDAVLAAGESWLRRKACTAVLAPMEVCTWFPYRSIIGPHSFPPFPMEPRARPEPWLVRGYSPAARYDSVLVPHQPQLSRLETVEPRLLDAGFTVRPWSMEHFQRDLRTCWGISRAAFASAHAFVPLPFEAFRALYTSYRGRIDPRLVLLVHDPLGQPAGFCFTLAAHLGDSPRESYVVFKTLAVHPSQQKSGLGRWLLSLVHRAAMGMGLQGGLIHALMWRASPSQRMAPGTGRHVREYVLFRREL